MVNSKPEEKEKKPFQKLLQKLQQIPDLFKWFAALLAGVSSVVVSYSNLAPAINSLLTHYLTPLPSNLVTYVSSDPSLAKSYLDFLSENGLQAQYFDLSQINELPNQKSGIIIFGDSNYKRLDSFNISNHVKQYLAGNVKILGIGEFGSLVFAKINPSSVLGIGHVAHGYNSLVSLKTNAPQDILKDLSIKKPLYLSNKSADSANVNNSITNVAVYDEGSLPIIGAEGIAKIFSQDKCEGGHWSVVIEGNHILWGDNSDLLELTENGKKLFLNLIEYLKKTPYQKLEQKRQYFDSGTYEGTLRCNFIENIYPFKANQAGEIKLHVNSNQEISLILNKLGVFNSIKRVDKVSPEITYFVKSEELKDTDTWFASVNYFGTITPSNKIKYKLTISSPFQHKNYLLWYFVGILGLVLLLFVFFKFLGRLRIRIFNRTLA